MSVSSTSQCDEVILALQTRVSQLEGMLAQMSEPQKKMNETQESPLAHFASTQSATVDQNRSLSIQITAIPNQPSTLEEWITFNFNAAIRNFGNAKYHLGLSYYGKKHFPKALEQLGSVPQDNPNFEDAQYIMGLIYFEKKELDSMIGCFDKVTDAHPSYFDIQSFIGRIYYEHNNYAKAIEYLIRVPAKNSHYMSAQGALGKCYAELREYSKARQSLKNIPETHRYFPNAQQLIKHIDVLEQVKV